MKKDEVKVEVEHDKDLYINGKRKVEKKKRTDKWQREEHSNCEFFRCFRLPKNAKANKMTATLDNEVLTITVPKEKTKKHIARIIDIC